MKDPQKIIKYLATALAVIVLILIVAGAFRLGMYFAKKNNDPTAPAVTEQTPATDPTSPAQTNAPDGTAAPEDTTDKPAEGDTTAPAPQTTAPTPTADAPRNLDISMSAGNLTFVSGDVFNVKYDDAVIDVEENGNSLTIENDHSHPTASERRRMDVTVTVPDGCVFDAVDIEMGAGKLIVHTLQTGTLELELGAGSATLENVYVSASADIQEGAGELNIKSGSIANLTLQCGAGATRVSAALTGSSSVNAAFGAVDLQLEGDEADYTVAFQMGIGACYFNNEKIARNGAFGEGPNRVDISGAFGVMRVNVG